MSGCYGVHGVRVLVCHVDRMFRWYGVTVLWCEGFNVLVCWRLTVSAFMVS